MPKQAIQDAASWVSLNFANGVYLIKDWILLNVGIRLTENSVADIAIEWMVGLSLVGFNLVRIIKYVRDMKKDKE